MNYTDKIYKSHLCIGCGICSSVAKDKIDFDVDQDGFYKPITTQALSEKENTAIEKICPGTNLFSERDDQRDFYAWGNIRKVFKGASQDKEVRTKGSSGGIISQIAIYLLETKKVDAVLQVGVVKGSYIKNALKVSLNREDVLSNASSRYAPALVFDQLKDYLDQTPDRKFLFIGKPCDVTTLNMFLKQNPQYKKSIALTVAIFCAGMPSYNGTYSAIKSLNFTETPVSLKYRGDGWPGFFKVTDKDGNSAKMTYNDSWGKILNRHLHMRCKICPDGVGMEADIAVGDAWETNNGYPDFTEREGQSLIVCRSSKGESLVEEMEQEKSIYKENESVEVIKSMQPYQYQRSLIVGWRLLAVQSLSYFMVNSNSKMIFRNMIKYSFIEGLKQFKGTFVRMLNSSKKG